jgi:hypothetical protein
MRGCLNVIEEVDDFVDENDAMEVSESETKLFGSGEIK